MMASKLLLSFSGFALSLLCGVARAQPNDAQKETARNLMVEARQLRESGDMLGALRRFNAADAIMNVPTTGFEVASTQAQLGELVEARETLLRLLAIPQSPDDPEPFNEARAKARTLDQQLAARIGSITLQDCGIGQMIEIELSVDGKPLPAAMLGLPFRVNPGKHQVATRLQGRALWREVDVAEGQTIEVPLECASAAKSTPPAPLAPPSPSPPATRRHEDERLAQASSGQPVSAYVGAGIGLLGVGVGTTTGVLAISRKNTAIQGCVKDACPPSTWRTLDRAEELATISTVSFVVGGLGVVTMVGSLLLAKPRPARTAWVVSPEIGRQAARLNVTGRF
jgi:hypothetical protein